MNLLDLLFILGVMTAGVQWLYGHSRTAPWIGVFFYLMQLLILLSMAKQLGTPHALELSWVLPALDGHVMTWRLTGLGWFFAVITVAIALLASWFMAGETDKLPQRAALEHNLLAWNVWLMIVLLASNDFFSLFVGWELVGWAGFVMMAQRGGLAVDAAARYLLYAMAGSMALLAGITLIYLHTHSPAWTDFVQLLTRGDISTEYTWAIVILLCAGFFVKMANMPFHLWQADAYSHTPGASAAFLSAVGSRMGLFAMAAVLLTPMAAAQLHMLAIPYTFLDAQTLIAWLAAFTMIIPTYIALQQTDARWLLAWHGIGQSGFMLLGLVIATPMSVAGGLLHTLNYASYQAALFLAVTAVLYRAGTVDLDRLGGLITRMPWTYVVLLMGIIGLAGLPPMNGFVSKWLIYKSLLEDGRPLLLIAASISTLGTILSVYKLIHNIFLGRLRKEHFQLQEAPLMMLIPMFILAIWGFLTGMMPGLALALVDKAQAALGYPLLPHHLGGVNWPTGGLNMLWVVGMIFYGFAIGALIFFFLGNKRTIVHQWDNYAGGHFLSADVPYHYSHNFYPGLMRVITPWFRGTLQHLESVVVEFTQLLASLFHGLYRAAHTPLYLLITVVLALAWLTRGI